MGDVSGVEGERNRHWEGYLQLPPSIKSHVKEKENGFRAAPYFQEDISTKVQTYSGCYFLRTQNLRAPAHGRTGATIGDKQVQSLYDMGISEEMLCLWFVGFAAHGAATLLCERPTLT